MLRLFILAALIVACLISPLPAQNNPAIAASIRDFLKLSPHQTDEISLLRIAYMQDRDNRAATIQQVLAKLETEQNNETPDFNVLGQLYIEYLRLTRAENDSINKLGLDTRKVLTQEQTVILASFKDVQRLKSVVDQMECEGFLERVPDPILGGFFTAIRVSGFPIFCTFRLNELLGVPFAFPGNPQFSPTPAAPDALDAYLAVTPDQKAQITMLQRDSNRVKDEKNRRRNQVLSEFMEAIAISVSDPVALGLRLLELETIDRELREENAALVSAIQAKLSPAQLAKLKTLEESRPLPSLDMAAQNQGYLLPAN
jgi:hypothetical protein